MDRNRQQEEFSNAFIQAVASTAGYSVTKPAVDNDSIDWTIARAGGAKDAIRSPRLELQLKSISTLELDEEQERFSYPLPKKNYEDLRHENVLVPRILVVVRVPAELEEWSDMSDRRFVLRHCAYWVSLRGFEESDNTESVTVELPTDQQFTAQTLRKLMATISDGGQP